MGTADQAGRVRDGLAMGLLAVLGAGIPLGLATVAGAIGLPHNDDWVYIQGAEALLHSGSIAMSGHNAAAIGQLVLVQPLLWLSAGATWAYTAFGLAAAAISVAATYALARFYLPPAQAILAPILLLVFPGFLRESASFMTDGPALALALLSLLAGIGWLRGGRRALLVASLGLGIAGASVREFDVVAPLAVVGTAWLRTIRLDHRRLLILLSASLALVGAATVVAAARASAPTDTPVATTTLRILLVGPTMTTLAAVLLPLTMVAFSRWRDRLRATTVVAGIGVVGVALLVPTVRPLIGQTWASNGLAGDALLDGVRAQVIGPLPWSLTEELAILGAVLAASLVVAWATTLQVADRPATGELESLGAFVRSDSLTLVLFLSGYAAAVVVSAAAAVGPFDRYLYPMVPAAAILLAQGTDDFWRPGRVQLASHLALLWLGVSAVMIATNSFAFDVARWQAGEAAVGLGYQAQAVDAGYEWVGTHAPGQPKQTLRDHKLTWYDDVLLAEPPCAVVSSSRLTTPGFVLLSANVASYRQYLLMGPVEPLYLYGAAGPGCPVPTVP